MVQTILDYFNQLFGEYVPVLVTYSDGSEEAFINFGTIANYVFIGIVLYCICKTIGTIAGAIARGVTL